jgi:ACT domain-containing protein
MPRKSYKAEEIVAKLRQVDVLTSQGKNVAEAIRSIGISEVSYYRLASGVRRVEERPGEAAEGPGNGEHPAARAVSD